MALLEKVIKEIRDYLMGSRMSSAGDYWHECERRALHELVAQLEEQLPDAVR